MMWIVPQEDVYRNIRKTREEIRLNSDKNNDKMIMLNPGYKNQYFMIHDEYDKRQVLNNLNEVMAFMCEIMPAKWSLRL